MAITSYSKSGRGLALNTDAMGQLGRQVRVLAAAAGALSETLAETQRDQARDLFERLGLPMPSLARARSCKTPDCGCEGGHASGGLGTLRQVLDRAEVAHFTVKLRNTDCEKRSYVLQSDKSEGVPELMTNPSAVTLEPGQSAVVQIIADASKLGYGQTLRQSLRVQSDNCAPQILEVEVSVERPPEVVPTLDLTCCCDTGMRPQKWYHHYYCDPPKGRYEVQPGIVAAVAAPPLTAHEGNAGPG